MAHKEAKDAQLTLLIYSKLGLSNILLINSNLILQTIAICLYFIKMHDRTRSVLYQELKFEYSPFIQKQLHIY